MLYFCISDHKFSKFFLPKNSRTGIRLRDVNFSFPTLLKLKLTYSTDQAKLTYNPPELASHSARKKQQVDHLSTQPKVKPSEG